jgi:hypothetical protein
MVLMARYGSDKVSFFLIAGLDVVGTLTEFEDRREARTEECHTLGDGWVEYATVGVKEAEITQTGFYDDVAGSVNDALSSGPGASNTLAYSLEGTATGAEFVAYGEGVQVNYQRLAERDALTKAKATYRLGPGGRAEHGLIMHTYKPYVDDYEAYVGVLDMGAAATGAAAYFAYKCTAGEVNAKIMHSASAGNTSYTALLEFTKTTSGGAHGAERKSTTGTVKRYVCAQISTASATGPAPGALSCFVGFVPKPQ